MDSHAPVLGGVRPQFKTLDRSLARVMSGLEMKKSRQSRVAVSAGTIWEKVGSRRPATQTQREEGGNWIR